MSESKYQIDISNPASHFYITQDFLSFLREFLTSKLYHDIQRLNQTQLIVLHYAFVIAIQKSENENLKWLRNRLRDCQKTGIDNRAINSIMLIITRIAYDKFQ